MKIEQHPDQLDKLRITSKEHGIGYGAPPVFAGTPEFAALLNRVSQIEVATGFGDFTLRKPQRHLVWL